MIKKIFSYLLIFVGIAIILYPTALEKYNDYKQKKILEGWETSFSQVEISENILQRKEMNTYEVEENRSSKEEAEWTEKYIEKNMEGTMKIDKINFYQPILSGATKKNLDISVASIDNTGEMGKLGNYAIAGHRNRTYGRNFNRLGELNIGDIIEVDDGKHTYRYDVFQKVIVSPENIEVLLGNGKDKIITLVTCDYSTEPSSRLIIKGKILE